MRLALAAALAVTLATPASAACYVEGLAGGTISHNKLESPGQSVTIAGDGYTAGIGLGCDFAVMDKFIAGPVVRVTTGHINATFDGAAIKSSVAYMGGAKLGYLINPNTRAYVLIGYQQTDLTIPQFANWTGKGLVLGIGGDIDVMENIRVGLELDRTQMSGISDGGGSIKPAAYSGLVTLKYSLPSLFK
jgi:opacity protein-like surface antigen